MTVRRSITLRPGRLPAQTATGTTPTTEISNPANALGATLVTKTEPGNLRQALSFQLLTAIIKLISIAAVVGVPAAEQAGEAPGSKACTEAP